MPTPKKTAATAKKTVAPKPEEPTVEPTETVDPALYRVRDKMTREMVKDLAKEGKFHEVNNALYAYGIWLEYTPAAFKDGLTAGPTARTFTCRWPNGERVAPRHLQRA